METTLHHLAARVPPPQCVQRGKGVGYRYREKTIYQAIVQKLARVISGLRAASLLMQHGFFQEQRALQRVLDELNEDIVFLGSGVIYGDVSPLHIEYLHAFYEEEFDKPDDPLGSSQRRPMIKRQKIHAYLAKLDNSGDTSSRTEILRPVSRTYSGFVHAALPHIMDMYGGLPAHFHVAGMLATPHAESHRADIWNTFYRSIGSFVIAAKAFGDDELFAKILEFMRRFAAEAGRSYAHPTDEA